MPRNQVEAEIKKTLELVMLTDHEDKLAEHLSGGMKRKLSLGMSLIGNSKLVILDEPTSGLDVDSRRQVWDLVKNIKKTRSVILSTQHINEADELADVVSILSHGKLIVKDKPWNIKKEFGVGYSLLIEKKGGLALNQEKEIDSLIKTEIEGLTKS